MLSIVLTTFADETSAKQFAKKLLVDKLAACVQLDPITSLYNWQDKCIEEPEVRMVIKIKTALIPQLSQFFQHNHPYDIPQFIEIKATSVAESYLNWAMQVLHSE